MVIMRQSACLVVNQIKVHSYDVLSDCKTAVGTGPRVNDDHDLDLSWVLFSCVFVTFPYVS